MNDKRKLVEPFRSSSAPQGGQSRGGTKSEVFFNYNRGGLHSRELIAAPDGRAQSGGSGEKGELVRTVGKSSSADGITEVGKGMARGTDRLFTKALTKASFSVLMGCWRKEKSRGRDILDAVFDRGKARGAGGQDALPQKGLEKGKCEQGDLRLKRSTALWGVRDIQRMEINASISGIVYRRKTPKGGTVSLIFGSKGGTKKGLSRFLKESITEMTNPKTEARGQERLEGGRKRGRKGTFLKG